MSRPCGRQWSSSCSEGAHHRQKTLSRRLAATGAVTALTAGVLVGATSVPAQAAPVQNQAYTCESALGAFPLFLTSDAPDIANFPSVPAGLAVPAGLLAVQNTFTVPTQVRNQLAGAEVEELSFPDFAGSIGSSSIPVGGVTAKVSQMTDNGNGTWSVVATEGFNGSFETPRAGSYSVLSPETFVIAGAPVPVTCAADAAPGSYHTLLVTKNGSVTTAKVKNAPVNKGERARLGVTVAELETNNEMPTGKVVVKKGTKTVGKGSLNDAGKDTIKLDLLPVGKHELVVKYKGDGYTKASKTPLTLKVVR